MEITAAQRDVLLDRWDSLDRATQRIQIVQANQVTQAAATLEAERVAFRALIFDVFGTGRA